MRAAIFRGRVVWLLCQTLAQRTWQRFDGAVDCAVKQGLWVLLSLLLLAGCSDDRFAMRLTDGTALHLDWVTIGGASKRLDRLLLTGDGYARRNRGGNLYTLLAMTEAERNELAKLRARHGPFDLEAHTGPNVKWPSARRLRFDGRGASNREHDVVAFSEKMLGRLAHEAVLARSSIVVTALVQSLERDGRATLKIDRVLKGSGRVRTGDRVETYLRDSRPGAGGVVTVFTLSEPTPKGGRHWRAAETGYLKRKVADVVKLLARQER